MPLTMRYVALTDTGLRRSTNQDSGYASSRLLAVADGMGGAAAGDLASSEAMGILRRLDTDLDAETTDSGDALDPADPDGTLAALDHALSRANTRLGELIDADPAVEGMGTTVEAMVWDGERFATAHIGDSRAYRLRDAQLTQLSTDHTFVQSLVDEGRITPEEARSHPHRSLLLRVLLGRDDYEPELGHLDGRAGDRYLLCSDGLTDMVDDDVIAEQLGAETIDYAAQELVRLALEGGGVDNVTVVIGELVDGEAAADDRLSSADGRPQLVGAVATAPRARTGAQNGSTLPTAATARRDDDATRLPKTAEQPAATEDEVDPEEARYAPRAPRRGRWFFRLLGLVVVVALIGGALRLAYDWSQRQYFVGEADGKVAVYRGIEADIPGTELTSVVEETDIALDSLPSFRRQQVEAGIDAASREDADMIVDDLSQFSEEEAPEPTPEPTPSEPNAPGRGSSEPGSQERAPGSPERGSPDPGSRDSPRAAAAAEPTVVGGSDAGGTPG